MLYDNIYINFYTTKYVTAYAKKTVKKYKNSIAVTVVKFRIIVNSRI